MKIGCAIVNISYLSKKPFQTRTTEAQGKQIMTNSGCIYHEPYAMIPPGRERVIQFVNILNIQLFPFHLQKFP